MDCLEVKTIACEPDISAQFLNPLLSSLSVNTLLSSLDDPSMVSLSMNYSV